MRGSCPDFSQKMFSGRFFPDVSGQVGYFFDPDSFHFSGHALKQKSNTVN